jgi:hypothetical protein
MRNEELKIDNLLHELKEIKSEIRKVSMIIESRLLGQEVPTREEVEYIKRFEKKRKEGKIKLIPLKEIEKEIE